MALCSRTDTANSREMYAGREVTKSCAVSNFVSADRIQVDRIGLRWNWIESRSNLVASANAPYEASDTQCPFSGNPHSDNKQTHF